MPDNKKHHYVPRFYLKRFSPNGQSISVWNIENSLRIPSANLKHQCYKNYLYGTEATVEKALGVIEGNVAHILRLIDRNQTPPTYGTEEYTTLIVYIIMQHGRTVYSADVIDDTLDKMMKHLLAYEAKEKDIDLNEVTIGYKNAAQYSLAMSTVSYYFLLDLKCNLLINDTGVEFVTSDNPVVLYNQLFSFRKYGSNTGYATKGLQVFLPISSKSLLIFYDADSYNVGWGNKPVVKITSPKDIYELNTLQMTSAQKNVYFENSQFNIEALHRKAELLRRMQKSLIDIVPGEETANKRSELMITSRVDIRANLKLSFIRLTKETKKWITDFQRLKRQPVSVVRNQKVCDDHEEFMEKVSEGKFNHADFFSFLAEKYDGS